MIDEKPVTESVSRLPPGPHAVGVSAPRYNFYADTVTVRAGEETRLTFGSEAFSPLTVAAK